MNSSLRAWPRPLLRLGLGLTLGLGVGSACVVQSIFTCSEDQNCIDEGGEGGVCEQNSLCTFPDESCDNGKRWHDRAGDDLGGNCFDPSDLGGSDSGTAGDSGSGTDGGSSSSDGGGSTTLPADDSGGSTDDGPPMTDDGGSSSSGGAGMSCDEIFGMVAGYQLCMETETTCSFNVTLGGTSCDALCGMYGSMMCQTAFTNSASDCASQEMEVACTEVATDNICVCVK